jgi:eukaryotic-like serine/threonine-protein kinase
MADGDAASNEHEPAEELLPEDVASAAPQATLRRPKSPEAPPVLLTLSLDASPSPPASDPYLGKIVADRYLVEQLLGLGSMGIVYRCRHTVLDKTVALKIIRQDLAQDDETVGRFMTEAKAASAIGSTHIVEVLDFGRLPDGATYIVMEYLEGITLGEAIDREGGLSLGDALDIGCQIAQALAAAHAIGIVHRDLKPDNVFLLQTDPGWFVKILDFGIAKVMHDGQRVTAVGTVIGTPHYMSPEQATGARTDTGTDIYSLGVMLYEMACGRVPFDAENPLAVVSMQVTEEPQPLRKRMPPGKVLPVGLEAVIHKCLAKDPIERFASMDDVRAALERIAGGGVPLVAPPSSGGRLQSDSIYDEFHSDTDFRELRAAGRRRRWFARGSLLLLAAAILGGSVYGARYWIRKQTQLVHAEAKAAALREVARPLAAVSSVVTPAAAAAIAPASVADVRRVALIMFPLDARALDGSKDLGMMPVMLEVPKGETKTIHIVRRNYVTRTLKVDGSKPRLVVGLVSEAVAARRRGISQAEAEAEADRVAATSAATDLPRAADAGSGRTDRAAAPTPKSGGDVREPARAAGKPALRAGAKSDTKTTLAPNPFGD